MPDERAELRSQETDDLTVRLEPWAGPWADDDPDANFKAEIALYGKVDPLSTIRNLAGAIDVPVGALCRYVLARWASEGSAGLLELGPTMVAHLWSAIENAEAAGTDEARLAAYDELKSRLSWLRAPLEDEHRQPLIEE